MTITLSAEEKKQAVTSVKRFCIESMDLELGDIEAAALVFFFLKEIGPSVYNAAIADSQAFLRDRLADLEATCYEPEFAFWPKGSSVRRK